jgi:hypothetical protein
MKRKWRRNVYYLRGYLGFRASEDVRVDISGSEETGYPIRCAIIVFNQATSSITGEVH